MSGDRVCPVCDMRVGMDMFGHITMQHVNFFKMQRKRRFRKGGSLSMLSLLKKELREGNLQSLLEGSSCTVSSSNAAPDPLLSSFIYNLPMVDEPRVQPHFAVEASSVNKNSDENALGRNVQPSPPLSDKDQEDKARRSDFVQGLLLSTILDDSL